MKKTVATIISRVFDPLVTLTFVLVLAGLREHVPWWQLLLWMMVLIVPPNLLRLWARRVYYLDWDIHDRRKRVVPFAILLVFVAVDLVLLYAFGPSLFFQLFVLFFVWTVGFLAVTILFTKISGHTSGNALAAGMFVLWYGWRVWPVLFIVPLVGWARVVRRDHTVGQVIAGALYSWGMLLFAKFVQLV